VTPAGGSRPATTWSSGTGGAAVTALAFSPDGKSLVTATNHWWEGGDINVWEAVTGKPAGALKGHTRGLFEVSFGPDGKTLVSAGWDATIRLWDFAARRPLRAIPSPAGQWIRSVPVSAGGQIISETPVIGSLAAAGLLGWQRWSADACPARPSVALGSDRGGGGDRGSTPNPAAGTPRPRRYAAQVLGRRSRSAVGSPPNLPGHAPRRRWPPPRGGGTPREEGQHPVRAAGPAAAAP
jgi:hypothetical protein